MRNYFYSFSQMSKTIKLYRCENDKEQKGLWRDFDGTFNPKFHLLSDGQCRNVPMPDSDIYRQNGKKMVCFNTIKRNAS